MKSDPTPVVPLTISLILSASVFGLALRPEQPKDQTRYLTWLAHDHAERYHEPITDTVEGVLREDIWIRKASGEADPFPLLDSLTALDYFEDSTVFENKMFLIERGKTWPVGVSGKPDRITELWVGYENGVEDRIVYSRERGIFAVARYHGKLRILLNTKWFGKNEFPECRDNKPLLQAISEQISDFPFPIPFILPNSTEVSLPSGSTLQTEIGADRQINAFIKKNNQ